MPVVINEFEVVADPPPAAPAAESGPAPDAPALPPWTVHDVAEIVARAGARAARVRAD